MANQLLERPVRPSIRPAGVEVPQPSRWLIGAGVAMMALGVLALVLADATTLLSVLAIGAMLLVAALFQAAFAFTAGRWQGFGLHLLLAALYGIAGVGILADPWAGAATLTLVIGLLFATSGIFRLVGSLAAPYADRGWTILSGLVTSVLGAWVLMHLPQTSLMLLGTLFGVDMLFFGANLTILGSGLRSVRREWERL